MIGLKFDRLIKGADFDELVRRASIDQSGNLHYDVFLGLIRPFFSTDPAPPLSPKSEPGSGSTSPRPAAVSPRTPLTARIIPPQATSSPALVTPASVPSPSTAPTSPAPASSAALAPSAATLTPISPRPSGPAVKLAFPNKSGIPLYVVAARMVRELPTRNETLGNVVKANVWTGERVVHWLEAACGVPFSRAIILGELLRRQLLIVSANGSAEQRFLGSDELWRRGPGKKSVAQARAERVEVVSAHSQTTLDFVIVSPRRPEDVDAEKFVAAAPLIARVSADAALTHALSLTSKDAYHAISSSDDAWKAIWHKHHTVVVPALKNRTGFDAVLLLKDQELGAHLELAGKRGEPLGWSKYKYLYVYQRWLRLKNNSEIMEVTKYFQQFKKLVTGYGNTTEVEACYKFRVDGYTRLASVIAPWVVALLTDFMVWKPVNAAAFSNDMIIFDATEKRTEYKLNQSLHTVTPKTFDALLRHTLGVERKTKPTKAELGQYLNSRDPTQTYIAFQIALQQCLAPLDEIDYVIEFKRPYFLRGNLNWSFIFIAKEWALVFNLSSRADA